eukprot:CAMPEP_0185746938 /NCGR_PEP_ID=MMETSP1174-20130828/5606_1 /TAXON_ID=35687 /ORGANISM="Dictyocha speculum, Strain CCMP1381" /LENGTH=53 /DNA_ID=CAMNT_0028421909 /DNA_START=4 /DNA_END=161 /DNA_ORIENTATION=+
MTFDLGKVNIDLLCAILPVNTVPLTLDIADNGILDGVDSKSVATLNGPRVTNL